MSEETMIQSELIVLLIVSLFILLAVMIILKIKRRKYSGKLFVSDKIIIIFVVTPISILVVLTGINLFLEMSPLDKNGDVSNWATLVIEIGIGTAIGSSIFVYSNSQQTKSDEIIKKLGEQEKFRRIGVLDGIQSNLTLAKGSLNYIDQIQKDGFTHSPSFKEECDRLARFSKSLDDYLESNYYWVGELTVEISNINIAINNYAISQSFHDSKLTTIKKIRDKIEEIIPKVITLKEKI